MSHESELHRTAEALNEALVKLRALHKRVPAELLPEFEEAVDRTDDARRYLARVVPDA